MFVGKTGLLHDELDKAANFNKLDFSAKSIPQAIIRPAWPVGLYKNDQLNNCVVAALANSRRTESLVNDGCDWFTDDNEIIKFYAAVANTPIAEIQNAPGLYPIDVFRYVMTNGFKDGQQVPDVFPYVGVIPNSKYSIVSTMAHQCSAFLAIDLYEEDMDTATPWSKAPTGNLVGGHAIISRGCSGMSENDTLTICTWGQEVKATWLWLSTRLQLAYALMWS
jgi:hypothetical protein